MFNISTEYTTIHYTMPYHTISYNIIQHTIYYSILYYTYYNCTCNYYSEHISQMAHHH